MARSKKKVLERMQRVERPDKEEAYVFKEKLEPITLGAKNVLETEHLKNSLCEYDEDKKSLFLERMERERVHFSKQLLENCLQFQENT